MSASLAAVIDYACSIEDAPVSAKVLPDNPAAAWYARNGFAVVARYKAFLLMCRHSTRTTAS